MISTVLAMGIFSLVMSISPGPVNLIAMSIGANRGVKAALPFVSGATFGFTLLLLLIGLGLEIALGKNEFFLTLFSAIGSIFIIYLGYKVSQSDTLLESNSNDSKAFVNGALLQWLNPKAWGACLAGITAFGAAQNSPTLILFCSIYFVICFIGIGTWSFIGERIFHYLDSQEKLKLFNRTMGASLILIGVFLLYQRFMMGQ